MACTWWSHPAGRRVGYCGPSSEESVATSGSVASRSSHSRRREMRRTNSEESPEQAEIRWRNGGMTRREVPTFESRCQGGPRSHSAAFKNDKHRKQWLSSLGGRLLRVRRETRGRHQQRRHPGGAESRWLKRPETSRRVLQRVRVIFDWCKAQGYLPGDNPTRGLTKVAAEARTVRRIMPLFPIQQCPAFIQALREAILANRSGWRSSSRSSGDPHLGNPQRDVGRNRPRRQDVDDSRRHA